MEAEKAVDTAPDANTQAGDPFAEPNPDDLKESNVSPDASGFGAVENPGAEDERLAAIQNLDALVTEDDEAKAEAEEPEPEPEKLSPDEVRAIVKAAADGVQEATKKLGEANRAYQLACKLEAEQKVKPTLVEMNAIQKKVTQTETRRTARAMKALGELGFGDPKRKPHPPLFGNG